MNRFSIDDTKWDEIKNVLYRLGGSNAYMGFALTVYVVELLIENREWRFAIKIPYVDAAVQFDTTVECVERNIRTLVKRIWNHGNRDLLKQISMQTLRERPKSKEFLCIMADYFVRKHMEEAVQKMDAPTGQEIDAFCRDYFTRELKR